MPVTLSEAQHNATTALDVSVIDEFRSNPIFDMMTFDDAVNPAGGGATLTYGYRRLITTATAAFRAINSEYTPQEVTTAQYTTNLVPLGGAFQIDRVLARLGPAASSAVSLNLMEKIKSAKAKFGDSVVNGDTGVDANGFDGLSKALTGSATEDTVLHDWSGAMTQTLAFQILEDVDNLLTLLDGTEATAILGNRTAINKIRSAARWTAQYVQRPGPRQSTITMYGPAALIDAMYKPGGTSFVIPVNVTDPDAGGPLVAGSTSIYAVRFGLDGFHGVSTVGAPLVQTWLPRFDLPGAVKSGEVEIGPIGVALKATKAAAVYRNVKVQ